MKDGITLRGFARVQLLDKKTKKIIGDSGWGPNTVTTYGLNNLAGAMIAASGSAQAKSACLATMTDAVNVSHVSLVGVENAVKALTPSSVATGTARMTCSFDGSDNSAALTIGAVGLHSTAGTNTNLMAGKTFTTSAFATNQQLNLTYEFRLS
jgi:hypothetical protein